MNLPINIDDILYGKSVEWERLEFKKSWNPEAVMHTLCAFANDFHNLGGGYIVIGVEENKGRPILPPSGISSAEIDKIQKEIIQIGHRIQPDYHPIIAPYEVGGKLILILWSGGGQTRPYKAPVSMSRDCREYAYYIRKGSITAKARHNDEVELINMAASVPFDDRIHHTASLDDLDFGLIRTFLRQIGSGLYEESSTMDFLRLCRQMNIVDGPDEFTRPKNIGLMFFNENPGKFFPQTQIDVVQFPEGRGTGIPKRRKALKRNQSPRPIFHSDDDRTFFAVEFPIHSAFLESDVEMNNSKVPKSTPPVTPPVTPLVEKLLHLLNYKGELGALSIREGLDLKDRTNTREAYISPALKEKYTEMTIPDKPNSRLQKYRRTAKGKTILTQGGE